MTNIIRTVLCSIIYYYYYILYNSVIYVYTLNSYYRCNLVKLRRLGFLRLFNPQQHTWGPLDPKHILIMHYISSTRIWTTNF